MKKDQKKQNKNYAKNSQCEKNPEFEPYNACALSRQKESFAFVIKQMASSQGGRSRGRARQSQSSTEPPPPSITPSTDISISTLSITEDTSPSATSPVVHDPELSTSTTLDTSGHDTGFSSPSSDTQPKPKSVSAAPKGRGRPRTTKQNVVPDDPCWMVTNLTDTVFYSNNRPKKPDELGTLGDQIEVIANYFPILQFPHRGLVYKYQIQIRNWKNLEIHRERRR
jgi:hypothetical protein